MNNADRYTGFHILAGDVRNDLPANAALIVPENKHVFGPRALFLVMVAVFTGLFFFATGFGTLQAQLPSVITGVPGQVTTDGASLSGSVTSDGGSAITSRGFVYGKFALPTLDDEVVSLEGATGAMSHSLSGLTDNTTYYVRAFASNANGTAYGANRNFRTLAKPDPVFVVVALDGSGDYTKVQDAFNAVPDNNASPYTIFVKNGIYYEKLHLTRLKHTVRLIGESRDSTILTYDDYANIAGGTSNSYSVSIDSDDFIAANITFQNTVPNDGTAPNQQAVALSVNGDRQAYYNVRMLGYQDTFYARGAFGTGRIYVKNSYIEGSVDFIFGRNIVVFDSTHIHINRNNGIITAASTESGVRFGFVFRDATVTTDEIGFDGRPVTTYYLGRPWREAPRTVFINTSHPSTLHPQGWRTWNVQPALYAEYNCMGPGCEDLSQRLAFSRQLTSEEAAEFTLENIFSRSAYIGFRNDWMPPQNADDLVPTSVPWHEPRGSATPNRILLHPNYPNPFNPATVIPFELADAGYVRLTVHDVLGRNVATLIDAEKQGGRHEVKFNAGGLAGGVYVYRLESGAGFASGLMSLIK
jgi:pectin methylesterase-like acyl-CoA thioesterase